MRKSILLFPACLLLSLVAPAQLIVTNLLTENLSNPMGLGVSQPRFTWQLVSEKRNVEQTAYELKVMNSKSVVWNTGKVISGQSVHIVYEGSSLQSEKYYTWQV